MPTSKQFRGIFPFEFTESVVNEVSDGVPLWIHVIPIGEWDHDTYGHISISASDIREFVMNFDAKVRKGVFITAGHEGFQELPAEGWFSKVEARSDGLWGMVEWNARGQETLKDKLFKFFSPEFFTTYEDPETHQIFHNVLTGGALTKSPYFKELEAVVFSDKSINRTSEKSMDVKSILNKKKADRTDEEKDFLKKNCEKMSEDEKKQYDEESAVEASEKKIAGERPTVQISASELATLREAAEQGKKAFAEIQKRDLNEAVGALVFSTTTNPTGRFLPKSEKSLREFMETLDAVQRKLFAELVKEIPASKIFSEEGGDAGDADPAEKDAATEVDEKTNEKVTASEKGSKKLSYSAAMRQVFAEDKDLEKRYNAERQANIAKASK